VQFIIKLNRINDSFKMDAVLDQADTVLHTTKTALFCCFFNGIVELK